MNARHVTAVPGRKADVKDAPWPAALLRHGLVRASCVPDRAQRELRELPRDRTALIEERTAHVNRPPTTLESATLTLGAVASDVTAVSARARLARLGAAVDDPAGVAEPAQGRLRDTRPELARAPVGRFGAHHRSLVPRSLAAIDVWDAEIADLDARIAERARPFADAVARRDGIPGVDRRVAEIVVAEVGARSRASPPPGPSPPGPGGAPAPTRAPASGCAGRHARGTSPSGAPASRPPTPPAAPDAATSAPDAARRTPPSPTRSSSSPTTRSPARPPTPTPTSAPTTSTAATPPPPNVASSSAPSSSATRSPSSRSHDPPEPYFQDSEG